MNLPPSPDTSRSWPRNKINKTETSDEIAFGSVMDSLNLSFKKSFFFNWSWRFELFTNRFFLLILTNPFFYESIQYYKERIVNSFVSYIYIKRQAQAPIIIVSTSHDNLNRYWFQNRQMLTALSLYNLYDVHLMLKCIFSLLLYDYVNLLFF